MTSVFFLVNLLSRFEHGWLLGARLAIVSRMLGLFSNKCYNILRAQLHYSEHIKPGIAL
jgi:hypothetical protein